MALEEQDLVGLMGAFGSAPAAGITGAIVAPDKRIRTGVSSGAGALGGGVAGSVGGAAAGAGTGALVGGLGGAGLGALLTALGVVPDSLGKDLRKARESQNLSTGSDIADNALSMGMLGGVGGAGLGALFGASGGAMYGGGRGAQMGYNFIHPQEKQGSHMQQNNVKLAFNLGAFQAIKEAEVDPLAIIQLAEETQDPELLAVAEALLELADAMGDDGMGPEGMESMEGMDPGMEGMGMEGAGPPPGAEMGMDPGLQGMGGEEDIDPAVLEQLMALTQGA